MYASIVSGGSIFHCTGSALIRIGNGGWYSGAGFSMVTTSTGFTSGGVNREGPNILHPLTSVSAISVVRFFIELIRVREFTQFLPYPRRSAIDHDLDEPRLA